MVPLEYQGCEEVARQQAEREATEAVATKENPHHQKKENEGFTYRHNFFSWYVSLSSYFNVLFQVDDKPSITP